jgi:two-component system, LytTR family, response regulator LytT
MKVVILEDETLAADKLENELKGLDENIEVLARLKSVTSAIEWFNNNQHPDLIFSDIQLLDGLSFELFAQVKIEKPVIFTTAFDQYAIKAFEVNSLDYLLKPISKEKLEAALLKFKNRQAKTLSPAVDYKELVKFLKADRAEYKTRFMVRLGQKIVAIPIEKIAYFFSENKLTYIFTKEGKKYPADQPLDELTDLLDPRIFFRANRQFIVTFESIAEIHPYFKGRIKLMLTPTTTEEVVISSERSPEFKKWIDQ